MSDSIPRNHRGGDDGSDNQSQDGGSSGGGNDRWDMDQFNQMDFVCTFLDNEEDTLPELFDPNRVPKQKSDSCALCETTFSTLLSTSSKHKRHHCRKCGLSVCTLCSSSPPRRLSKIDKKKYRVCDACDTLLSNPNFEGMYQGCLKQQEETLAGVKAQIGKRELQMRQLNSQLDKYKKTYELKLREISDKESQKRALLTSKQQQISDLELEHASLVCKLSALGAQLLDKDADLTRLTQERDLLREERRRVEEERRGRDREVEEQNQKLHKVIKVEYENSFKANQVMEVEDVEERFDWKAGDTSYEESYSVKERVLENAAAGNYY